MLRDVNISYPVVTAHVTSEYRVSPWCTERTASGGTEWTAPFSTMVPNGPVHSVGFVFLQQL